MYSFNLNDENIVDLYDSPTKTIDQFETRLDQIGMTDESQGFIKTTEMVFDHIKNLNIPGFDYSPCGLGLWKAFEFELNATFVDWIRLQKGICISPPSTGKKTLKPLEQIKVYSGKNHSTRQYYFIDINKHNRNDYLLIPVMLNDIANLLQHAKGNDLVQLTNGILSDYKNDIIGHLVDGKWTGLPADIRTVANEYRNGHAHTKVMTKDVFLEFKNFLLPSETVNNSPLRRVLSYKREIWNNFS